MNLSKMTIALFLGLSTLSFISCTKNAFNVRAGIDPALEVKAEGKIEKSLTAISSDVSVKGVQIKIQKSALEKEFLLMGSLIPQIPVPMLSGLKSRVVAFKKVEDKIYMLEATQGHIISEDLPMNLLLAKFPVTSEDETSVVFDFNSGMSQIFVAGDWFTEDSDGASFKYNLKSSKVVISYIDEAKVEDNQLVLRQIAQLSNSGSAETITAEVKYYLSPYNPDPTFVPVKSPGLDKVGFFEVSPLQLKDGSSIIYSSKWNDKKPIVYAISANTPAKIKPAIRDGILYWNKILGESKVQVIELTDKSITAPDSRYNIVQWVNWDQAGFAYADSQMDPRSGEVLHAQVFMTSVFSTGGRAGLLKRIRYLEDIQLKRSIRVSLKGFEKSPLCFRQVDSELLNSMKTLATGDASDELIDKATLDYVREVVAHEIGHTLGLRHNFAGSLAANFTSSQKPDLFKTYLKTMAAPEGVVSSSSVMEYEPFEESLFTGDMISKSDKPADSYDAKAIGVLYKGDKLDSSNPLFCTDTDLGKYFDCNQFDSGSSVIEDSILKDQPKFLAQTILNLYIVAKVPKSLSETATPVEQVNLDAKKIAEAVYKPQYKLIKAFTQKSHFVAIRRLDGAALSFNEESTKNLEKNYVSAETNRLGGFTKIFEKIDDQFQDLTLKVLTNYLDNPKISAGAEGTHTYSFNDLEKAIVLKNVKAFLPYLEKELRIQELKSLSGQNQNDDSGDEDSSDKEKSEKDIIFDHQISTEFATYLGDRQQDYLYSKTSEYLNGNVINKDGNTSAVKLPIYKYQQTLRLLAAGLMGKDRSEAPEWSLSVEAKTNDLMTSEMKELGVKTDDIAKEKLSADIARWLLNNLAIIDTLEK